MSENKMRKSENYYDYITPEGLEAIRNIEGHTKFELAEYKGKKIMTGPYGITQEGFDSLKTLRDVYNVDVPEVLINTKLTDLTTEQCKDVAGYVAMLNTKMITNLVGPNFEEWTREIRTGFLMAVHAAGIGTFIKGLEQESEGSFLYQTKMTGNPYKAGLALISDLEGKPLEMDSITRRYLLGLIQSGNPTAIMDKQELFHYDSLINNNPAFYEDIINSMKKSADSWDFAESNQVFLATSYEYEYPYHAVHSIEQNLAMEGRDGGVIKGESSKKATEIRDNILEATLQHNPDFGKEKKSKFNKLAKFFKNMFNGIESEDSEDEEEPYDFVPTEQMTGEDGNKIFEITKEAQNGTGNENDNLQ